jgi:hypothetical protein
MQLRGKFGRGASVVGAEQGREHPGRHAWHACVDHVACELLDEGSDGNSVTALAGHPASLRAFKNFTNF